MRFVITFNKVLCTYVYVCMELAILVLLVAMFTRLSIKKLSLAL